MKKDLKQELIEILVSKSLKVEDEAIFELASGRKSNIYIDCKKTTLSPKGLYLIKNIFFDKILKFPDIDAIGGLSLGADPIAIAVASISQEKNHPIHAFVVRKEPKKHGLKRNIEGDLQECKKVVIVDDVVTTGNSTVQAIRKAREDGLEVIKVLVLVDRQEESGRENIEKENVKFEAIVTKQDLLDAYYSTRENIGRSCLQEPKDSNRLLQK